MFTGIVTDIGQIEHIEHRGRPSSKDKLFL